MLPLFSRARHGGIGAHRIYGPITVRTDEGHTHGFVANVTSTKFLGPVSKFGPFGAMTIVQQLAHDEARNGAVALKAFLDRRL